MGAFMKSERNYYLEISYIFNSITSTFDRPFYRLTEWGYSPEQIDLVKELDYKITSMSELVEDVGYVIRPECRKEAELLIKECARKCLCA